MMEVAKAFLSLPVGGRAVLFLGAILGIWLIFARPLLKVGSILPWLLKKIFFGLYMLLEIPVSALHSKFGSIFAEIDQGITRGSKKISSFLDQCYQKMQKPKKVFGMQAFIAYFIVSAYLLVPIAANRTEKPFTFWQQSYIEKEKSVIKFFGLSLGQDGEKLIALPDTTVAASGEVVSLSNLSASEQPSVTLSISTTSFFTSLQYNDQVVPFYNGSSYNFMFDGEEAQLRRVVDFVYLFCEHGIWCSPLRDNTQFVLDTNGWYASENVVFYKYSSLPNGLPIYAIAFSDIPLPQAYLDTWYDLSYDRNLIVNDAAGKQLLTLSRIGNRVQLLTTATVETLELPCKEILFCYEDGEILKYSDNCKE